MLSLWFNLWGLSSFIKLGQVLEKIKGLTGNCLSAES